MSQIGQFIYNSWVGTLKNTTTFNKNIYITRYRQKEQLNTSAAPPDYLLLLPPLMARMEAGMNENLYLLFLVTGAISHWPEGRNLYSGFRGWELSALIDDAFLSTCSSYI